MTPMKPDAARALVADALERCGTGERQAASVARALVEAECLGLEGHGLARVPSYAVQVRSLKMDGHAEPSSERVGPALLVVDAVAGFAYPALDLAVDRLPVVARDQGIAAAAIRRSHHRGAAGLPAEELAQRGLVALLFADSPATMAP